MIEFLADTDAAGPIVDWLRGAWADVTACGRQLHHDVTWAFWIVVGTYLAANLLHAVITRPRKQ